MKARLYFESHITVEDDGGVFDTFAAWARGRDWRASRFSEDEVDDYNGKWFMSARGTDLEATKTHSKETLMGLYDAGYTVLRWKVEDTLLDSKHGDTLP